MNNAMNIHVQVGSVWTCFQFCLGVEMLSHVMRVNSLRKCLTIFPGCLGYFFLIPISSGGGLQSTLVVFLVIAICVNISGGIS